jgi:hypothetical protein
VISVLLLLTGCANYEPMSQSWMIDRTRILGVQAEVASEPGLAEPRPGDRVVFRSLVVHPDYSDFAVTWMGCLPDDANNFGCEVDIEAVSALFDVDIDELTNQELLALYAEAQELGFLGLEPYFSPFLVVPEDVLADLTAEEQLEGLNYFLTLSAFPLFEDENGEWVEPDLEQDDNSIELAYKRMPVSTASTPNHNPELSALTVDGYPIEPNQVLHVTAGQSYALDPILGETAIEAYEYVTSNGETETRIEEPYFTFYATGGSFDYSYSLYPYSSVQWTAPDVSAGAELRVWVVIRDRRGGMGWWTLDLVVDRSS